jgi:hypothetical protein
LKKPKDGGANLAPDATRIDQWSDLSFQFFNKLHGTSQFKDIKFVIRDAVNNAGSKNIMQQVEKDAPGNIVNGKGTFDLSSSNPAEVNAAKLLIGSPNGGAVWYAVDYPKAFGFQKITKVHSWNQNEKLALAFEFGPRS